jgi:hypothetical protein
MFHDCHGSVSFGTKTREYFGSLPAEIVCADPESVINCVACTVFKAHLTGRKEGYTYLKNFVLEKLGVPDWPRFHTKASPKDSAPVAA